MEIFPDPFGSSLYDFNSGADLALDLSFISSDQAAPNLAFMVGVEPFIEIELRRI